MACKAWVALPAITTDKRLSYPRCWAILFLEFLAAYLGTILIVLGIYLAVSPQLPQYSVLDRFSLSLLPLIITWIWNENYFYLLIIMFFSLLDNTAQTFERPPVSGDLENWAEKCISIYEKLRKNMNLPLLFFMSIR